MDFERIGNRLKLRKNHELGYEAVECNALFNYLIILLDDMVYVYILYGFLMVL